MKTVTSDCLTALKKRSRQFKAKLDFTDFVLEKVESLSFTHQSSTSAGLTLGTCAIGSGKFSVKKDTHSFDGKQFTAYIGVTVGTSTEWINMGKYTVKNVDETGIEKTVTFEDDISKLDIAFDQQLTYPVLATTMLSSIATLCGVQFDTTAIPSTLQVTQDLTKVSCRNIVKLIAQLVGKFVVIDTTTNKIAFKWYTDSGLKISQDNGNLYMINEPTFDRDFTLGMIVNNTGTETLTSGEENATDVISIQNPMLNQTALDGIYDQIGGFEYTGTTVEFKLGMPVFDPWDIVQVEYKGKSARIPLMSVENVFDGGFASNIKSFVRNENTAFEGQLTKIMDEFKTQITVVDGKVESKVSKNDIISSINQSPEEIKISADRITLEGGVTFADLDQDTQDKIQGTKDTVDSWSSSNDTTMIDGGKIFAKSITSDQIDVSQLFAEDINISGKFTATSQQFFSPTEQEWTTLSMHLRDDFSFTIPEDKLYLYDFNGDGEITQADLDICSSLVYGSLNILDYIPNLPPSTLSVTIDPRSKNKIVAAEYTNAWGTTVTTGLTDRGYKIYSRNIYRPDYADEHIYMGYLDIIDSTLFISRAWLTRPIIYHPTIDGHVWLRNGDPAADEYTMPSFIITFEGTATKEDDPAKIEIDLVPLVRGLKSNIQEQLDSLSNRLLNNSDELVEYQFEVDGDKDTYYPVVINMGSESQTTPKLIIFSKKLGSKTADYPNNHSSGTSALYLSYETVPVSWDGNGGYTRTLYKFENWATLVATTKLNTANKKQLVTYLRGGGTSYRVRIPVSYGFGGVFYEQTNVSDSDTYPFIVEPMSEIQNGGEIVNSQGSSSVQFYGTALTAKKLTTNNAGSVTNPVYFKDGVPVATTYTLGASVPANAKFTDTVYTLPNATSTTLGGVKTGSNITNNSGTISLTKANVTSALGYTPARDGTVLYNSTGIYCNGKNTPDSENSVDLADSSHSYKRLTLYIQCPYGVTCQDFPLDKPQQTENTSWGNRQGGVIFPTGDSNLYATKGYDYKILWRVIETTTGWTVQVTDSGWINNRIDTVNVNPDWQANNTVVRIGTNYYSWNQRHDSNYNIYKIVGWTV